MVPHLPYLYQDSYLLYSVFTISYGFTCASARSASHCRSRSVSILRIFDIFSIISFVTLIRNSFWIVSSFSSYARFRENILLSSRTASPPLRGNHTRSITDSRTFPQSPARNIPQPRLRFSGSARFHLVLTHSPFFLL